MNVSFISKALPLAVLMLGAGSLGRAAEGPIQAKLWVVSVAQASDVVFPAPSATPDATFTTNGIAYIGQQRSANSPTNCYDIGSWVEFCGSLSEGLKFSKLPNENLGGLAASTSTLMSGPTWGIMVELTGSVSLTNGKAILLYHDDGASLMIDGVTVPGFSTGVGVYLPESVTWSGSSGTHSFDLLYGNARGGGAWLLFGPFLYNPY